MPDLGSLAKMGAGGAPSGVGQMATRGQDTAIQSLVGMSQMWAQAVQSDPSLMAYSPDVEKLTIKISKHYGYEQEMKLALQRSREQMRASPPPTGPPPQAGGSTMGAG